jgi:hypothetical protein
MLQLLSPLEASYGTELAFADDDRTLATLSDEGCRLHEGSALRAELRTGVARAWPRFSPDGRRLVAGLCIYDVPAGRGRSLAAELVTGGWAPQAAVASPDARELFVDVVANGAQGSPRERLLRVSIDSPERQALFESDEYYDWKALAVDAREVIAAGMTIPQLRVFDRSTGKQVAARDLPSPPVRPDDGATPVPRPGEEGLLALDSGGRWVAHAGASGQVLLFARDGYREAGGFLADGAGVAGLQFHPSRPILATGGGAHEVRLWSLTPRGETACVAAASVDDVVTGLAFQNDDRLIVAVGGSARRLAAFAV